MNLRQYCVRPAPVMATKIVKVERASTGAHVTLGTGDRVKLSTSRCQEGDYVILVEGTGAVTDKNVERWLSKAQFENKYILGTGHR